MSDIDSQAGSTAAVMQRPPDRPAGVVALLGIDPAQLAQIDADKLEKLVGLFERHAARQAAEEYARAMQASQAEMPAVARSRKGENSRYAPLEEVHQAISPVYLRHGFSLSFGELPASKDGLCNLYCDVRHVGGHTERHTLEGGLDVAGPKGGATKTAIQGKGSTVSYLRRYLTLLIFNVTVADEDRDGAASAAIIGREELRVLSDLLDDVQDDAEAYNVPFSKQRFLDWLGVQAIDQLPARQFAKAVSDLNRKRRKIKEPKP